MDDVDGDTPDLNVAAAMQLDDWIVRMCSFKPEPIAMKCQSLEREGPVKNGDHNSARPRIEASVHHQKVTVMNACTAHGMTANAQEKSAGGMADQLFIEIDSHVHVVIGGGREASGDPFPGQGQRESTALGLQGKRSVLELHGSSDN